MRIPIVLDGRLIARAVIDALDPMGAAARAAVDAVVGLARELEAIRRDERRRRRRAKYEIREAITARRLGVPPEPWRGKNHQTTKPPNQRTQA